MSRVIAALLGASASIYVGAQDAAAPQIETEAVEFQTVLGGVEGSLNFQTYEDAPTWRGILPKVDGAVAYRLSCYPKLADEYTLEVGDEATYNPSTQRWTLDHPPEFTYNSDPDVMTRTMDDADVFSYTAIHSGWCPKVLQVTDFDGIVKAPGTPPINKEHGPFCKAPIQLVYVYIEPVNDAPIANNGEQYLSILGEDDIMIMNTEKNDMTREALDSPYTLTGELIGSDVDGDTLTYTIFEQPKNGKVWIVENNVFKYVPNYGFVGEDQFVYQVDDRLGGGHILDTPNSPMLTSTATVLVQVEPTAAVPEIIPALENGLEDVPMLKYVLRKSCNNPTLVEALRYEIVVQPNRGEIVLHCEGVESYDPNDCEAEPSLMYKEKKMWYTYTPRLNYFGEDGFAVRVYPHEMEDIYDPVPPGAITIAVAAVNDPPVIETFTVSAPMYDPEFLDGKPEEPYTRLPFRATDVDSTEMSLVYFFDSPELVPEGNEAKMFTFDFASGKYTEVTKVPQMGLPMRDGNLDLYYQAPPRYYGEPLSTIKFYVIDDGGARSQVLPAKVNVQCIPGHHRMSDNIMGGACAPCAPGSISVAENARNCQICPEGTYGPGGTSICHFCQQGTHNPAPNAPMCTDCPFGSTSDTGAVLLSECYCDRNFYGPNGNPCTECPGLDEEIPWTSCPHFGLLWPLPQSGSWVDTSNPLATVRTCTPLEACEEITEKKDDVSRVQPGETCAEGYTGEACSKCSDDFYRLNGSCEVCPDKSAFGGYVFAFLLVVFLPILLKAFPRFVEQFAYIDSIIMYTQATSVLGSYDLNWPDALKTWMVGSSITNLNLELLHLECNYVWDFKKKWTATMVIPVVLIAGIILFNICVALLMVFQRTQGRKLRAAHPSWGDHWFLRHLTGREFKTAGLFAGKSRHDFFKLRRNSVRAILIFFHMAYCFVALGAFEMFDCVEDPKSPGNYYLESAPYVQCYEDGTWNDLFIPAVICVIVYPIGIFLVMAALLHAKRHTLEKRNTIQMMGFMVERFTPQYYWFELVFLARFLVYTGLSAADIGAMQATVCNIVVLLLAVLAEIFAHPYKRKKYQLVESVSLMSNFFTLLCGMIYLDTTLAPDFRDALTVINIITILGTYFFFAFIMLKDAIPQLGAVVKDYFKYGKELSELAEHDSLKASKSMKDAGVSADAGLKDLVTANQSRFLTPAAMAAAVRKRKNEDVEGARDLFDKLSQHVDAHLDVQDTVGARVVIEDALHPAKRTDLIKRLAKRKLAENKELQDFIDDLFDVSADLRGAGAITKKIEASEIDNDDDEEDEEEADIQPAK